MRGIVASSALLIACAVTACSGDDPGAGDAAVTDGASDGGLALPGPVIPWLADGVPPIMLTPCPSGWRELPPAAAGDVATCDPYPASGAADCAPGQAHFPGEPACSPIGSACPTGDWPEGLPTTAVRYVRAGAPVGGDGSLGAPYARIADALRAAPVGTTVALAKGRYDEVVSPGPGVTIVGACAAETIVAPRALGTALAAVNATRVGHVTIRDLTVADSIRWGINVINSGVEVELFGVEVRSATSAAILVGDGGHLVAHGLAVRDTRPDAAGLHGRGLDAEERGTVQITRAVFERNGEVGIFASNPETRVELRDILVRDTQAQRDGFDGYGVNAQAGATVSVSGALFDGNREYGLYARGPGTTIMLADAIVRDTQSRPVDLAAGVGLGAESGARLEVSRVLLELNREVGILLDDAPTTGTFTDVIVRDTRAQESDGSFGRGLDLQNGPEAEVDRALFERNLQVAIVADGAGTRLRLTDIAVRDTESRQTDGEGGRGINIAAQARVEVQRALFERNREIAVFVDGDLTGLQLSDVVVRDTRLPACAATTCSLLTSIAVGFGAYGWGRLGVRRFEVDGSELCGVQVAVEGELDLHEGVVRRAPVGACVQRDGYDLNRLLDNVVYLDVASGLVATTLPVPGPLSPLAPL